MSDDPSDPFASKRIPVTGSLHILKDDLTEDFVRASGPGGQNVNKVSTAVQLRFNLAGNETLPQDVKSRAARLAGSRLTLHGEIILQADRFRTRERNREDALERLLELLRRATEKPKPITGHRTIKPMETPLTLMKPILNISQSLERIPRPSPPTTGTKKKIVTLNPTSKQTGTGHRNPAYLAN